MFLMGSLKICILILTVLMHCTKLFLFEICDQPSPKMTTQILDACLEGDIETACLRLDSKTCKFAQNVALIFETSLPMVIQPWISFRQHSEF